MLTVRTGLYRASRSRCWKSTGLGLLVICWLALSTIPVFAQTAKQQTGKQQSAKPQKQRDAAPARQAAQQRPAARAKRLPGVTPEREAAVLTFVGQHHPELTRLLTYLSTHQPRQYQRAIRELARTVERLALIHERDMERHDLELRIWKAKSHLDLLTAKWKIEPSSALKEELRGALADQVRAQHDLLRLERERIQGRLDKLDAQIERLEQGLEEQVEKELLEVTKKPRRAQGKPGAQTKTRKKSDE